MKITKDFYTSGFKKHTVTNLAELYVQEIGGDVVLAKAFVGKQSKPKWFYKFENIDKAMTRFNSLCRNLESYQEFKKDQKLKRKERRDKDFADLKAGDLFSCSWGYEQTNVDFYQVVEVKKSSFVIREIGGKSVGGYGASGMSDHCSAVKDSFITDSKPMIKTSFGMKFGILSKTTEQESHYRSWYH